MGQLPFFRQISMVRNTQNILYVRPVIMLAGYIRSGKTYVLKEIERRERKYCNVEYHDAKVMTWEETEALFIRIKDSFINCEKILYLIDNTTYVKNITVLMREICDVAYENRQTPARVIFAGNKFLFNKWKNRLFYDDTGFVPVDFINVCDVDGDDYYEKCLDTIDEIAGISDVSDYLQSCINLACAEREAVQITDVDFFFPDVNQENLLDGMYSVLWKNYIAANENRKSIRLLELSYDCDFTPLKADSFVSRRIQAVIKRRHERFMENSCNVFKKVLVFLRRSGIVKIINKENDSDVNWETLMSYIFFDDLSTEYKDEYFRGYTVEFTTELFFSALINKLFTFQRETI